jgi:hypothetical protein
VTLEVRPDGLPCRVAFGGQTAVHEFHEWTKVRGAAVPGEIVTTRGGKPSDTVTIESLDASASLPADWFRAP